MIGITYAEPLLSHLYWASEILLEKATTYLQENLAISTENTIHL